MSTVSGNGPRDARRILRFGVFQLDVHTGELRKHGVKVKLQGKPLQVLQALVDRPGEVVTREELQQRLWPSDVFVDFENGLNTAANRLRIALGDSADKPRYIETLTRTGYRFIAPIEVVAEPAVSNGDAPPRTMPRASMSTLIAAMALIVATIGTVLALRRPSDLSWQFRQVTFRRGQIWGARFAPDGRAILYTANWDNGPRRLFLTSPLSPESRPLGFDDLRLVSVSRTGELALLSFDGTMPITGGALWRVRMNAGAPSPVERNIMSADWSPDGRMAIVRAIDGVTQLEFPPGSLVHKTSGWISGVRVSPTGDRIAFIEHPVRHDTRGTVKLVDASRTVHSVSDEWATASGIAWHPSRDEIWFTASRDGASKSLWAITPSGKLRPVAQTAGTMTLRDIALDGSALASRDTERLEMAAVREGETTERDLSWLDWSRVADVSSDGRLVLFDESGVAGGPQYSVYIHRLDDDATVRLGDGLGMGLSPDGKHALTLSPHDRTRLRILPLGAGKPIELAATGLVYQWARYFPDGRRLLALANEPGKPLRLYVQSLDGKPFPMTPPAVVRNVAISPDGTKVAVMSADSRLLIYPAIEGGTARLVPTSEPLAPLLWREDDWLFVQHIGGYTQVPTRVSRLHLATGEMRPSRELRPRDPAGVNAITKVMLSRDARTVIFNYRRVLSELFVLEPSTR
ncbi:MAG TPA: LpqB family beta-propeller domain-containing protein [Vicinamibacterales bacterium]|nr:LpqB family beta-propeller domain-containing protein [Vicinamibacterales bacterium]